MEGSCKDPIGVSVHTPLVLADEVKNKGNEAFRRGDYKESVKLYTSCLVFVSDARYGCSRQRLPQKEHHNGGDQALCVDDTKGSSRTGNSENAGIEKNVPAEAGKGSDAPTTDAASSLVGGSRERRGGLEKEFSTASTCAKIGQAPSVGELNQGAATHTETPDKSMRGDTAERIIMDKELKVHADLLETQALCNRALCYLRLKEFQLAERDCTAALAIDPHNIKALYRRACTREELNHLTECLSDLQTLMQHTTSERYSESVTASDRQQHERMVRRVREKLLNEEAQKQKSQEPHALITSALSRRTKASSAERAAYVRKAIAVLHTNPAVYCRRFFKDGTLLKVSDYLATSSVLQHQQHKRVDEEEKKEGESGWSSGKKEDEQQEQEQDEQQQAKKHQREQKQEEETVKAILLKKEKENGEEKTGAFAPLTPPVEAACWELLLRCVLEEASGDDRLPGEGTPNANLLSLGGCSGKLDKNTGGKTFDNCSSESKKIKPGEYIPGVRGSCLQLLREQWSSEQLLLRLRRLLHAQKSVCCRPRRRNKKNSKNKKKEEEEAEEEQGPHNEAQITTHSNVKDRSRSNSSSREKHDLVEVREVEKKEGEEEAVDASEATGREKPSKAIISSVDVSMGETKNRKEDCTMQDTKKNNSSLSFEPTKVVDEAAAAKKERKEETEKEQEDEEGEEEDREVNKEEARIQACCSLLLLMGQLEQLSASWFEDDTAFCTACLLGMQQQGKAGYIDMQLAAVDAAAAAVTARHNMGVASAPTLALRHNIEKWFEELLQLLAELQRQSLSPPTVHAMIGHGGKKAVMMTSAQKGKTLVHERTSQNDGVDEVEILRQLRLRTQVEYLLVTLIELLTDKTRALPPLFPKTHRKKGGGGENETRLVEGERCSVPDMIRLFEQLLTPYLPISSCMLLNIKKDLIGGIHNKEKHDDSEKKDINETTGESTFSGSNGDDDNDDDDDACNGGSSSNSSSSNNGDGGGGGKNVEGDSSTGNSSSSSSSSNGSGVLVGINKVRKGGNKSRKKGEGKNSSNAKDTNGGRNLIQESGEELKTNAIYIPGSSLDWRYNDSDVEEAVEQQILGLKVLRLLLSAAREEVSQFLIADTCGVMRYIMAVAGDDIRVRLPQTPRVLWLRQQAAAAELLVLAMDFPELRHRLLTEDDAERLLRLTGVLSECCKHLSQRSSSSSNRSSYDTTTTTSTAINNNNKRSSRRTTCASGATSSSSSLPRSSTSSLPADDCLNTTTTPAAAVERAMQWVLCGKLGAVLARLAVHHEEVRIQLFDLVDFLQVLELLLDRWERQDKLKQNLGTESSALIEASNKGYLDTVLLVRQDEKDNRKTTMAEESDEGKKNGKDSMGGAAAAATLLQQPEDACRDFAEVFCFLSLHGSFKKQLASARNERQSLLRRIVSLMGNDTVQSAAIDRSEDCQYTGRHRQYCGSASSYNNRTYDDRTLVHYLLLQGLTSLMRSRDDPPRRPRHGRGGGREEFSSDSDERLQFMQALMSALPREARPTVNGEVDEGERETANHLQERLVKSGLVQKAAQVVNSYVTKASASARQQQQDESLVRSDLLQHNNTGRRRRQQQLQQYVSPNVLIAAADAVAALAAKPAYRATIVREGGFRMLLSVVRHFLQSDNDKFSPIMVPQRDYRQGIARVCISVNPSLFTYQEIHEAITYVLPLLEDDHELFQYEGALAITNLTSVSDEAQVHAWHAGAWDRVEDLIFSDNPLLRAAGLECWCNLSNSEVVQKGIGGRCDRIWDASVQGRQEAGRGGEEKTKIGEKEKGKRNDSPTESSKKPADGGKEGSSQLIEVQCLKLLLAFCLEDENVRARQAAAGALATLVMDPRVAAAVALCSNFSNLSWGLDNTSLNKQGDDAAGNTDSEYTVDNFILRVVAAMHHMWFVLKDSEEYKQRCDFPAVTKQLQSALSRNKHKFSGVARELAEEVLLFTV